MSRCASCPIAEGRCRAEAEERYRYLCGLAAEGRPSALAMIRNVSGVEPPPPPEPPSYPSLARTLVNAAKAVGRGIVGGFAKVDQAEYDRRHAICEACPSKKYDAEADRCMKCSCHLSVKPWLRAERCPLRHW